MEKQDENWSSMRAKLFEEVLTYSAFPLNPVCHDCGNEEGLIRCFQCGPATLLCSECDSFVHSKRHPLHDRQVWNGSFYQPISPMVTVSDEKKLIRRDCCLPTTLPSECPECGSAGNRLRILPKSSSRIVVTVRGRYDLKDSRILCDECDTFFEIEYPHRIIREHLWPGTASSSTMYIFDQDMFLFYDLLQKNMPGISETGFLKSLEQFSVTKGRNGTINPVTFSKSFEEWRYCQFEIKKAMGDPIFECPCCTPEQHSVHVDGNRKLYRYSKVPKGNRKQYYNGAFVVPNEEVDAHLSRIGYIGSESLGMCGTTRWKAAKAVSKTLANQDETGLEVAACRHCIALKSLNMFRGEIFGYPHYLHTITFPTVKYLWADVMCQYWPWAQSKLADEFEQALKVKPCLSVMHSQAHSWHCQILWNGRWVEGAAAGSGEEVEQLFSYLSRFNLTTKHMNAAGREEHITEGALFWNDRKVAKLPYLLEQRLKRTQSSLIEARVKLVNIQDDFGQDLTPDVCKTFKAELQSIARREVSVEHCDENDVLCLEYYRAQQSLKVANAVLGYVSSTDTTTSAIAGFDILYEEASKATLDIHKKEESLHQIQKCLSQPEDVIVQGASRAHLRKLEEKIEMAYLVIRRKEGNVRNATTSSKQRAHLRKSIAEDKKRVKKYIDEHNNVIQANHLDVIPVTEDDVLQGQFPWSQLSGRHCVSTQKKLEIVTLYNLICRLEEEEKLIFHEMTNFLKFYRDTIPAKLNEQLNVLQSQVLGAWESSLEPQSETNEIDKQNKGYQLSARPSMFALLGKVAMIKTGLSSAKNTLLQGLTAFRRCTSSSNTGHVAIESGLLNEIHLYDPIQCELLSCDSESDPDE